MRAQHRRHSWKQCKESGAEVKILPMLPEELEQYQVNVSMWPDIALISYAAKALSGQIILCAHSQKWKKDLSNTLLPIRIQMICMQICQPFFTLFPWKSNVTVIPNNQWRHHTNTLSKWAPGPRRTLRKAINKLWATRRDTHGRLFKIRTR